MNTSHPVTVVLADTHESYSAGLARAITEHPRLELVGVAGDGREALALILRQRPDIAVLDVRLPGLDGFAVSERLTACQPVIETRIVLLTAVPDAAQYTHARGVGAYDCLEKGVSREQICDALVNAAAPHAGARHASCS
jgi:two-component system, NarL family, nitrate/nitrite response regulator NarL